MRPESPQVCHLKDFGERGSIEFKKERASLAISEMIEYLINKGYESSYSLKDFRRGKRLLEKKLSGSK